MSERLDDKPSMLGANVEHRDTNWVLQSRIQDNTRTEYGWSYRTEQIQIILLQEIRDALFVQIELLRKLST